MIDAHIPDFEGFDWSNGNDQKILSTHGVSPLEVEQVFFNSPLLAFADHKHSQNEVRIYVLGQTDEGRMLFVAFTIRKNRIRPISARNMSRNERRIYSS